MLTLGENLRTVSCPEVLVSSTSAMLACGAQNREFQRDQRRIGRLQSTVDRLVEVDVLLVVVESKTRQHAETIRDQPFDLSEGCGARVAEREELIEAVAIEQAGCRSRRCGRQAKPAAEPCSCLNDGLESSAWLNAKMPVTTFRRGDKAPRNGLPVSIDVASTARRNRRDRQADEVTIVGRIPLPVSMRRRRGHTAGSHGPVDDYRSTTEVLIRLPARIRVREPVERVEARWCVSEVGRDLRVLAIGRAQRRRNSRNDLRSLRPLPRRSTAALMATLFDGTIRTCPLKPRLFRVLVSACVAVL